MTGLTELFAILVNVLKACWYWIYLFCPFKVIVVDRGELGVRYTLGKPGPNLVPGIRAATALQRLDKDQALLTTKSVDELRVLMRDRVPVKVNGVVAYDVTALGQYQTSSSDTHWLIGEFAQACAKEELTKIEFSDFHDKRKTVETAIRNATQKLAEEAGLGLQVKYFRTTSFEVMSPQLQLALAIMPLVRAISQMPEPMSDQAKVALLSAALPVNTIESQPVTPMPKIDEPDEPE
jgi:hypothetical protein